VRRIISSGSVKAIYLNKDEVLAKIKEVAELALQEFPEIKEVRLFGSFASGETHALSDVDIIIIIEKASSLDLIKRIKPYYSFFSQYIDIALDLLVIEQKDLVNYDNFFKQSQNILTRRETLHSDKLNCMIEK